MDPYGWGWLAAAAAWLVATNANPAPASSRHDALPIEGTVVNPDWISKPSGDDVSRFYPALPRLIGLSGRAMLTCSVTALGILEACSISGEIPAGMGFGAATLQLAPYFHMRPMSVDGAPVSGAQVAVPVLFQIADEVATSSDPSPSPPPSETALALGRRLSAAQEGAQALEGHVNAAIAGIERQYEVNGTPQAVTAVEAFRKAYTDGAARLLERAAAAYARSLTQAQLRQAVAFAESPTGQAVLAVEFSQQQKVASDRTWDATVLRDARKRFCALVACMPEAGSPRVATPDQGLKP